MWIGGEGCDKKERWGVRRSERKDWRHGEERGERMRARKAEGERPSILLHQRTLPQYVPLHKHMLLQNVSARSQNAHISGSDE